MKRICTLLTFIICLISLRAKSDHFIIKGDTFWTIFFSPFDSYPGIDHLRSQLKGYGSDCTEDNCSFLSTWKIVDGHLMLARINNCDCNEKKQTANLEDLFGGKLINGMLPAYWYTGEIWVTKDKPNSWGGMFAASWPREIRLIVKKGVVISVKNFDYPPPVQKVYYRNTDSLNKYIATHINWQKIRNVPQRNNGSYFRFDQDANGYLINIKYDENSLSNQTFTPEEMTEISRVLGTLQWPLYYHRGQVVKNFTGIVILLNQEMRDRYAAKN